MSATTHHPVKPLETLRLDLVSENTQFARQRLAWQDVLDGARLWRLGITLGWLDIKLRYRGSVIGPFWLTLSTGVMIGALGGVYGTLFHMNLHDYLPFLALSLVLWNAASGVISEACTVFMQAEGMIRSVRMPFFLHAVRLVVRNVLTLGHNVVVIVVVFALFDTWPGAGAVMTIPALALWLVDAFACCLLLGSFCARFRDIPPIVASIVQIAFFITPIVWKSEQLGAKGWWLPLNPFYALLEIARAPLLGQSAGLLSWASSLGYSLLLIIAAWLVFARVRARLAFWI